MVNKPKFDVEHTDWDVFHYINGAGEGWNIVYKREGWSLMCILQSMEYIPEHHSVWLCERHYQQAIERGYIW